MKRPEFGDAGAGENARTTAVQEAGVTVGAGTFKAGFRGLVSLVPGYFPEPLRISLIADVFPLGSFQFSFIVFGRNGFKALRAHRLECAVAIYAMNELDHHG